jgi:hypothetical protein
MIWWSADEAGSKTGSLERVIVRVVAQIIEPGLRAPEASLGTVLDTG